MPKKKFKGPNFSDGYTLKNLPILRTKWVDSTVSGGNYAFVSFKADLFYKKDFERRLFFPFSERSIWNIWRP